MNKIKISVIVPIYSVEKYLPKCIESIQNQSLRDIEIILVDDGSLDKSGLIADEYSKLDERINVIHKKNGGLSSARNEGILLAKGEYISFIDSDDWIEKDMLKDMLDLALVNDIDIAISGVIVEYSIEGRQIMNNIKENIIVKDKCEIGKTFWKLQEGKLSNYAWNKIYRTSFIKNEGLSFIEDSMPAEDILFNLTAFSKAKSIAVLSKAYYHYIRAGQKSILSSFHENLLDTELKRYISYKEFFNHFKMEGAEYDRYLNDLIVHAYENVAMNLYRIGATYKYKERVNFIHEKIFTNKELKSCISSYSVENTYDKIFVFLLKKTTPFVMDLCYTALFCLRRNLNWVYIRFRERQLN